MAFVVVAGPTLVVLGSSAGASNAPVTTARTPPWWAGPCDANHWDPEALESGWSGPGAHPLGASYLGVQVCGPRPAVDGAPDIVSAEPGWGEYEWECVELAMRFMFLIYGVRPYPADGDNVVSEYKRGDGGGLVQIQNGTAGEAPEPGDVISLSDGGEGHVVVVATSDVNSFGNGSITVMSQNDTTDGWRTLGVSDWWVEGFNIFTPTAWLHDPLGRGDPYAAPTVTTPRLVSAAKGLQYDTDLSAAGGSGPYRWSLVQGVLPPGMTLDHSTGVIEGVPTSEWTAPFAVRVTSATGASSISRVTFVVAKAHPPPLDAADFDDDLAVG